MFRLQHQVSIIFYHKSKFSMILATPVAAFNPTSPEKATSAYATPGGNVVGGAVSVS
jgi:hypothetical protein